MTNEQKRIILLFVYAWVGLGLGFFLNQLDVLMLYLLSGWTVLGWMIAIITLEIILAFLFFKNGKKPYLDYSFQGPFGNKEELYIRTLDKAWMILSLSLGMFMASLFYRTPTLFLPLLVAIGLGARLGAFLFQKAYPSAIVKQKNTN